MLIINARPRTRTALLAAFTMCSLSHFGAGVTAAEPEPAEAAVTGKNKAVETPNVSLASTLVEGEGFRYSIRSRHVQQHQKPDETIEKWIKRRTAAIRCEVLAPNPEIGPRVRVTIEDFNCTILSPSKALRFTSEYTHMNVVGSAMTLAMEPIVGAEIVLTLDQTGMIRQIEGTDVLLKEKELRQYAEHMVGNNAIDELIQPIFSPIVLGGKEQASAESLRSERHLEFDGFATFDFDERWALSKQKDGRATFKVESDVDATIDERWPDAFLKDSRSIGSYTWDELSGRLHHTEINRFYVVNLDSDPDGPSIAGEEVLTISAPLGQN